MTEPKFTTATEAPAVAGRLDQPVRRYPLSVENVGEDTYILMSKGHHDVHEFMRAVRADYSWPLGMPTHEWMRAIPAPAGSGYRCLYVEAKPHARGAFPATYVSEAWGEDSYEAQAPNAEVEPTQGRQENLR